MNSQPSRNILDDRLNVRLDREEPYLRIGQATLFVSDQDRSLAFFIDQLGFSLVADRTLDNGERWVAVVPPDGTAILELIAPTPEAEEYGLIGKSRRLLFITEDVDAIYERWLARGVRFHHPPITAEWGGAQIAKFDDPDGNTLMLAGVDQVTQELELRRRNAAMKLEAERRAAQEWEIARNVQMRLFPQTLPVISALDCAGLCVQAREVGGDYYDFLDLGENRLGLVIGDVAGKGMAAALLMVNLQANLRSHSGNVPYDPLQVLKTVNERFHANTHDSAYATLFLGEYDGTSRRLLYVNCGHLCGLVVRDGGMLERLESTSTVLGLFPRWEGASGLCCLQPGDTLVLYTDGVTESCDGEGDEFGEARLVESIRRHRCHPAQQMGSLIAQDVKDFAVGEQFDDITLIVAKVGRD